VERTPALPQLRAHADLVDPIGFEHFLRATSDLGPYDVMVEAKAKDLAVLWLRDQLARLDSDLAGAEERGPATV
jgi:UV DNA damage endonuclease